MALPYDFTCPGCSNKCTIKVPKFFTFSLPVIPALPALPPLDPQEFIAYIQGLLPVLPSLPALPDFSLSYAGILPSWSNETWSASKEYIKDAKIDVDKPIAADAKGERKTVLTYQALGPGLSNSVSPTWGAQEVSDGEGDKSFTWKLIATNKGTPGNCPNSKSDKR